MDRGNEYDVRLSVGIDSSRFEGGQTHIYTNRKGQARKVAMTTQNLLEAFSAWVSPPDSVKSIFVRVTRPQIDIVADYLRGAFGLAVRRVFTART